jgi:hypothetical protein
LSPKGEFLNRLEQALDLSKNVLDKVKRDLGNSLLTIDYCRLSIERPNIQSSIVTEPFRRP